jgi:hypothetical protein
MQYELGFPTQRFLASMVPKEGKNWKEVVLFLFNHNSEHTTGLAMARDVSKTPE